VHQEAGKTVVGFVHYMVFMRFSLLHGLQPLSSRAHAHQSASTLWLLEIGSLAFVAIGIAMLVTDHGNWLIALASIVFFGFGAVVLTCMLVLRWRAVRTQS
jgi:hypothetical protein